MTLQWRYDKQTELQCSFCPSLDTRYLAWNET